MKEIRNEGVKQYYVSDGNEKIEITKDVADNYVIIDYESNEILSRMLSNYFTYDFVFDGWRAKSVGGALLSLNSNDPWMQRLLLHYEGHLAYDIQSLGLFDSWKNDGILYFNGNQYNRFKLEYQILLNKLYMGICKNPLYAKVLASTGNKDLFNISSSVNPFESILTQREFIERLLILRSHMCNVRNAEQDLMDLSNDIVKTYK